MKVVLHVKSVDSFLTILCLTVIQSNNCGKCFLLIRGPKRKEQERKHSILISKGSPYLRFSLISDLEGFSVSIRTSYLVTSRDNQLKIFATSILTMRFLNGLTGKPVSLL